MSFTIINDNLLNYSKQQVWISKKSDDVIREKFSNIHSIILSTQEAVENFLITLNGVYDNIFILTANTQGLDVLLSNSGYTRGSMSDEEVRSFLLQQSILSVTDITRNVIKNIIQDVFDKEIDYIFNMYLHGYDTYRGCDLLPVDNIARFSFVVSGHRNFICIYKCLVDLTSQEVENIERYIEPFLQITNIVKVR